MTELEDTLRAAVEVDRGFCPDCRVDLEPALAGDELVIQQGAHPTRMLAGSRLCPICGVGWKSWRDVHGRWHVGHIGGQERRVSEASKAS